MTVIKSGFKVYGKQLLSENAKQKGQVNCVVLEHIL